LSTFNFQAQTVLDTTPAIFNQNYLAFLNAIASNMGVSIYAIVVLSINYGSVNITVQVSTTATPGSSGAVSQ
jgi:hypothetical protein